MRILPLGARLIAAHLVVALFTTACLPDAGSPAVQPAAPGTAASKPTVGQVAPPPAAVASSPPDSASPAASPVVARAPSGSSATDPNPAIEVYARNSGSVVNITSIAVARTPAGPAERQGTGSGFVLDNGGRIITNNHVVQDASQLNVSFKNGATVPASLVGRDPDNDLAVIRVDPSATDASGRPISGLLQPVTIGDSDRITIGEDAVAIGSPLGLQQTVTAGIVSAVRNPLEETARGQVDLLGGAIQTDAAVNPGNSGGPLFNAAGEVIGVNTAILSQSGGNIGIGFAIPANVVKRVVPELIQSGCYRHPFIGVSTLSLARLGQALKQQLGIQPNQNGLLVQESSAGAAQAGIRAGQQVLTVGGESLRAGGDIIVAVDGREVVNGGDLRAYIENAKRPGEVVSITVLRSGQRQEERVTLGERPDQQACR